MPYPYNYYNPYLAGYYNPYAVPYAPPVQPVQQPAQQTQPAQPEPSDIEKRVAALEKAVNELKEARKNDTSDA